MAGTESPHVAVVVLSFNGREDTLACVESLERMDWERLTTIVVDNASTDGTLEAVQERFSGVVTIRNEENLGFAEGNNVGMRTALEAGADHVLVLNNDTVTDEQLVAELVAVARARPDAGTLCPLIRYLDPPDRIWYAGARFDPRAIHNGRHTGYGERDVGQYHTVRETGRATGAAMLVPRRVLEEVGLFDSKLFIQVEDVDISLRMRAAGYRILFVPTAILWHRVAVTSGGERAPTTAYYEMRNSLAVSFRHAPARGLDRLRREAGMLSVHLLHSRLAPAPVENARAILEGWRDFHSGRYGPRAEARRSPARSAPLAAGDAARSRA